jgi:hypothetical protein
MRADHATGRPDARGTAEIFGALETYGFVRLEGPYTDADFVALAHQLGNVIDDTPVRVVPGKRTYLASPGPIPLHTDHPSADLIAWRCEAQDARDGASLLVEASETVRHLDAETPHRPDAHISAGDGPPRRRAGPDADPL